MVAPERPAALVLGEPGAEGEAEMAAATGAGNSTAAKTAAGATQRLTGRVDV